jgi:hypothetical protein
VPGITNGVRMHADGNADVIRAVCCMVALKSQAGVCDKHTAAHEPLPAAMHGNIKMSCAHKCDGPVVGNFDVRIFVWLVLRVIELSYRDITGRVQ